MFVLDKFVITKACLARSTTSVGNGVALDLESYTNKLNRNRAYNFTASSVWTLHVTVCTMPYINLIQTKQVSSVRFHIGLHKVKIFPHVSLRCIENVLRTTTIARFEFFKNKIQLPMNHAI